MSRKFGVVDSGFWRSRKLKGASDDAKLLCLYLISCPHGNSVGLFHIPIAYIQADLSWTEKRVRIQVSELVSRHILEFDFDAELVRFAGWWEHNPIDNGKHAAAVARQMAEMRCESEVFLNHAKALAEYAASSGKGYLQVLNPGLLTGTDTGIHTGADIQTLTLTPIPYGTTPAGAVDLKALVFSRGIVLLMAKGSTEKGARSFFGKCIAETSVGDTLEAIGRAEREDPADPISFIRGILKAKLKRATAVVDQISEKRSKAVARDLEADRRKAAEEQCRAEGLHPLDGPGMARIAEILREQDQAA